MQLDAELNADGTVRKPGQDYYLKPMNCPMHNLIYRSRGRSYRELPLRLFEFGSVYRYEKSGVVHGLTRARGFTQDDAHIYCTREQMQGEIRSLLQFVLDLLRDYGLDDFYLELSTRNPEKSIGSDEDWELATERAARGGRGVGPGAGARPGRRRVLRAEDQRAGQGRHRAHLADLDDPGRPDGAGPASAWSTPRPTAPASAPIMIHRALFGSIERFFGILTEHYAGAFPAWLAPVQAVAIPVTDEQVPFVEGVAAALRAQGIRVEVDAGDDRMQKKIRTHTLQKVPFLLLAGGARRRGGRGQLPVPRRVPAQRRAGGVGRRHAGRLGPPAREHLAERRGVRRPGRRACGGPLAAT